jgi:hypothetical protein
VSASSFPSALVFSAFLQNSPGLARSISLFSSHPFVPSRPILSADVLASANPQLSELPPPATSVASTATLSKSKVGRATAPAAQAGTVNISPSREFHGSSPFGGTRVSSHAAPQRPPSSSLSLSHLSVSLAFSDSSGFRVSSPFIEPQGDNVSTAPLSIGSLIAIGIGSLLLLLAIIILVLFFAQSREDSTLTTEEESIDDPTLTMTIDEVDEGVGGEFENPESFSEVAENPSVSFSDQSDEQFLARESQQRSSP